MENKTILLVDNMELALKMEEEILRRAGMSILTARSGPEALQVIQTNRPDLIFLEFDMPEISGHETCKQIKSNPDLEGIPVLIMIPNDEAQILDQCFASNCDGIIQKPLQQDVVLEKVSHLLQIKTRKLPRLNIETSVAVSINNQTSEAQSINLNQDGVLIKSSEAYHPNQNYLLTFALSPGADPLALWSRLSRSLPPGEGRNQSEFYLSLFRFLDIQQGTRDQIDQLANTQAKRAADKVAKEPQLSEVLSQLFQALNNPIEPYQDSVLEMIHDVQAKPTHLPQDDILVIRGVVFSLLPFEKNAITENSEDQEAIVAAIAQRAKFACDLKKLEAIPGLAPEDQEILKTLQKDYFKPNEKALDLIQERISAHMQQSNLEVMKQLNQIKTHTFQKSVAVKSRMNFLANPQESEAGKNYQYTPSEDDQYKVEAFNRPKPVEETKKEEAPSFSAPVKQEGKKSKAGLYATIFLWLMIPSIYLIMNHFGHTLFESNAAPALKEKINDSFPMKGAIRDGDDNYRVFVSQDWFKKSMDQKQTLADQLLKDVTTKGYNGVVIIGEQGKMLGSGAKEKSSVNLFFN